MLSESMSNMGMILAEIKPEHFLYANWKPLGGQTRQRMFPLINKNEGKHTLKTQTKKEFLIPGDLGDFCHDQHWSRKILARAK